MATGKSRRNDSIVLGRGRTLRMESRDGAEYAVRFRSRGVVMVVAVTDDARLVLIEQYRPALRRRVVELPAGLIGDSARFSCESALEAAERELLEETGYRSTSWEYVLEGPDSPCMAEHISLFLALNAQQVSAGGGDESEAIRTHAVPLDETLTWLQTRVRAGVLVDPRVLGGMYLASSASPGSSSHHVLRPLESSGGR